MSTWRPDVRRWIGVMVLMSFATIALAATLPAAAEEVHDFNVSGTNPATAIHALGAQAGIQILASGDDLKDKKFNSVSGTISTNEALSDLLAGTGLEYRYVGERAVALMPNPAGSTTVAQSSPSQPTTETTPRAEPSLASADVSAASTDEPLGELEQISVTGSRIQRSGFTAPTPTTIVGSEEIQGQAAVTVSQALFNLPSMQPTTTASYASAYTGGNYANLRGLGANRTLVLVDGERVVATTATNTVDLDLIPTALVERVEVVTGGASAAWGSDAVAGVVNFILKKKIEGLEGNVQFGETQYGDNKQKQASLAWGTDFADGRGQFMIASEYSSLYDPAFSADRPWSRNDWGQVACVRSNGQVVARCSVPGANSNFLTAGGTIIAANGTPIPTTGPTSALRGIQFGPGGVPEPFIYGSYLTPGNSLSRAVGGSGNNYATQVSSNPLQAPLDRTSFFARSTFDFTSNIQGFAEASYATSKTTQNFPRNEPSGDPGVTIQLNNAFLPSSIRNIMVANNLSSFTLGRNLDELSAISNGSTSTDVARFAAGLNGDLGRGWKWDVYDTYGETHYSDFLNANLDEANWNAATDTVIGPNGTPICRINSTAAADIATVSNPNYKGRGAAPGCVAADPFGPGSLSPAVLAYIAGNSWEHSVLEQNAGSASLQGEPFSIWAGPVSVVAGIEWRKDSISTVADLISQDSTPAFPAGGWQNNNRKPVAGSVTVKEFFAETIVPLLKDKPLVRSLELNAAARDTDYSTSGNVTTWKVGMTYTPIEGVLLRGTKSRDIRAPDLTDLYSHGVIATTTYIDYGLPGNPSGNSTQVVTTGNPNLKPEVASTQTIGITWEPPQVPGLHVAVDTYKILLKDNIASLGVQGVIDSCYGAQNYPLTPANCALIDRNPVTGNITEVINETLNLAYQRNSGVDYELGYRFPLSKLFDKLRGNLSLRALAAQLNQQAVNNLLVTIDEAGSETLPTWRWTVETTYDNGPYTLFLQGNYVSPTVQDTTFGTKDILNNNYPSQFYLNGSLTYTLFDNGHGGRMRVTANATDITNRVPIGTGPGDPLGRRYSLGVRFSY
jgi:iron complex outermembrane recepter protein